MGMNPSGRGLHVTLTLLSSSRRNLDLATKKVPAKAGVAHVPTKGTRDRVYKDACKRIPRHLIAARIGVSKPTLLKHYQDELDRGEAFLVEFASGVVMEIAQDKESKDRLAAAKMILGPIQEWGARKEVDVKVEVEDKRTSSAVEQLAILLGVNLPEQIDVDDAEIVVDEDDESA